MSRIFQGRLGAYTLLLAVTAILYLPGLGAPSLWDIDEGNNAECAWEMLDSGNWIVPTFNHKLRVDKPALLYWFQMAAYRLCGVNEFAARLPSALAAMLTVLLTYELGRRLFDSGAALLAGLVLASAALFCGSAHFANPDALLNACTVLTFLFFWDSFRRNSPDWLIWCGLSTGLAFLAKGPVGLVLPLAIIHLFLFWTHRQRQCLDVRFLLGALLWVAVTVPWFALVGAETKGEFLKGFFLVHNFGRFKDPMEGHSGPFFYHAVSVLAGFLPWSAFLIPTLLHTWREARLPEAEAPPRLATRFLVCWIAVYFVFFSISRTKLPNYVLPLYPAVALLTGRFLDCWRRGLVEVPRWLMSTALACWALIGVGAALGLLIAGGVIDVPRLRHRFPGLEEGVFLGLLPVLGAAAAWLCLRRRSRDGALGWLGASAVAFVGAMLLWGAPVLDAHKAPRALVRELPLRQLDREIRIGCYDYFQPSLVFYCGREVQRVEKEDKVDEFLQCPLPAYLLVPATTWERLAPRLTGPHRLLGKHWDLYRNCEVLVIGNERD